MPLPPPRRPLRRPEDDLPPERPRPLPVPPRESSNFMKATLQVLGMLAVFLVGGYLFLSDADSTITSTPDVIRGYARMNPLPASKQNVRVVQPDQSTNHQLMLQFTASDSDVENWLKASPGTQGVTPMPKPQSVKEYIIPTDLRDPDARPASVLWKTSTGEVVITVAPPTDATKQRR